MEGFCLTNYVFLVQNNENLLLIKLIITVFLDHIASSSLPDCDCHGHAESCHYDTTKGRGVCDNCTSPTTGDNCQFCGTFYRVNPWMERATNFSVEGALCTGECCT